MRSVRIPVLTGLRREMFAQCAYLPAGSLQANTSLASFAHRKEFTRTETVEELWGDQESKLTREARIDRRHNVVHAHERPEGNRKRRERGSTSEAFARTRVSGTRTSACGTTGIRHNLVSRRHDYALRDSHARKLKDASCRSRRVCRHEEATRKAWLRRLSSSSQKTETDKDEHRAGMHEESADDETLSLLQDSGMSGVRRAVPVKTENADALRSLLYFLLCGNCCHMRQ